MANDYKTDQGKPPVVEAVFIPFRRTLLAIAEMMERQAIRHKLQGARDPFQEWRQLPNGKQRLTNAGGRHAMHPWEVNAADRVGDHPGDLHILHALWGLMAGYEKHLEEQDKAATSRDAVIDRELAAHRAALADQDTCCGAPDARPIGGLDPGACAECGHRLASHDVGVCVVPGCSCASRAPIHGPAGADWMDRSMERAFPEHHQVIPRCQAHCVPGAASSQCENPEGHATDHYSRGRTWR